MMWPEQDPETCGLNKIQRPDSWGRPAHLVAMLPFTTSTTTSHTFSIQNKRRRLALAEIDKVPFGWYHVRAVAVAGAGFFVDSYDLFAVNLAIQMLGISFWQEDGGEIPANIQTAI